MNSADQATVAVANTRETVDAKDLRGRSMWWLGYLAPGMTQAQANEACERCGHEWIAIDDEHRLCGRCGSQEV